MFEAYKHHFGTYWAESGDFGTEPTGSAAFTPRRLAFSQRFLLPTLTQQLSTRKTPPRKPIAPVGAAAPSACTLWDSTSIRLPTSSKSAPPIAYPVPFLVPPVRFRSYL